MLALLRKEISSFLSSLIGYIVVGVFLLMIGLFMWVFEMETNVMDAGYADLDTLFGIAPWVFMFLIPAITMRTFSEEKRTGTIELLFTRPLSDFQIIFAKFLAGLFLVAISLVPTLIYYFSVIYLGDPVSNIDHGATWGSYVGLFFLGGGYVAIGVFASSITQNQVIAFILAALLCYIFFLGFDSVGAFSMWGDVGVFIVNLGIQEHYGSLSRGVIDTRDVLYFVSLIAFFLILTRTVLNSRKW